MKSLPNKRRKQQSNSINCHIVSVSVNKCQQINMSSVCSEIIDDIEDLISSQDITPKERYASRKTVNVRSRNVNNKRDEEPAEKIILESVVPGIITYFYFRACFIVIKQIILF